MLRLTLDKAEHPGDGFRGAVSLVNLSWLVTLAWGHKPKSTAGEEMEESAVVSFLLPRRPS